jgi:hypothetical protein
MNRISCNDPAYEVKLALWDTLARLLEYKHYVIHYDHMPIFDLEGRILYHETIGVELWSGDEEMWT